MTAADESSGTDFYNFNMVWRFDAPVEKVWDMINRPEEWPRWWSNCRRVERLDEGDAQGVGARRRFSMQTMLPYQLQFEITSTHSEAPSLLEGEARGNLEGTVRWELISEGQGTRVLYNWTVRPTKPWMRLLSPLLRPVFMWNHRSMMRNGGRGLARMMGAHLIGEEYR